MTADEMGYRLEVGYNRIASDDAPGITDKEKSLLLTEAQSRLVKERINPKGNRYNEGFDETEARKKGLSQLIERGVGAKITSTPILDAMYLPANALAYLLPSDVWLTISEIATVTFTGVDTTTVTEKVNVIPISYDEYNISRKNPYKKPFADESDGIIWRIDMKTVSAGLQTHIIIPPSNATITQYQINYIKQLSPIVLSGVTLEGVSTRTDCILNEAMQEDIVEEAIASAFAKIGDAQSYQISLNEANKTE